MQAKWLYHMKSMFLHACVLSLVVWLVLYTFTIIEANPVTVTTVQSNGTWKISGLLEAAVHRLKAAVMPYKTQRKPKLVLLWTNYFGSEWLLPTTKELACPVQECDVTSNRSLLTSSSAVVLHWRDVNGDDLPLCNSSATGQCPLWVLFNQEAPPHTSRHILTSLEDKVHLTISYRKDSDIYHPYGEVIVKGKHNHANISDFNSTRPLVCWLVSNCHSPNQREIYVESLKKYIDVRIYGRCGTSKCPHENTKDCYAWMAQRCTFYLSLENSNCKDYITEKLYYAMYFGMIPVVMGKFENYDHLPYRSYVHVDNFANPKELAEYLATVGRDQYLYVSYNKWRMKHAVLDLSYKWLCDLCEKLHSDGVQKLEPHKDLTNWWFDQSGCDS